MKVLRYTMVSVISAMTSLVILTIVFGVLRLWGEVVSTLFANLMAGIPSYYLNRRWVWGKGGRSHIWERNCPVFCDVINRASSSPCTRRHWRITSPMHTIFTIWLERSSSSGRTSRPSAFCGSSNSLSLIGCSLNSPMPKWESTPKKLIKILMFSGPNGRVSTYARMLKHPLSPGRRFAT